MTGEYTPRPGGAPLVFSEDYTAHSAGVPLVFGAGGSSDDDRTFEVDAAFGAFEAAVSLARIVPFQVSAAFGGFDASVGMVYDIAVDRSPSAAVASAWRPAADIRADIVAAHGVAEVRRRSITESWRQADHGDGRIDAPWQPMPVLEGRPAAAWCQADHVDRDQTAPFAHMPVRRSGVDIVWRQAARAGQGTRAPFERLRREGITHTAPWQPAATVSREHIAPAGVGRMVDRRHCAPWQPADMISALLTALSAVDDGGGEPPPAYTPDASLHFVCPFPSSAALWFGKVPCSQADRIIVPVRRVYLVPNSASLTILPDHLPLPCTGMQVAIDTGSWAWELTATIHGRAGYELLAAQARPVEVEAIINGYTFAAVVTSVSGSEPFGARTYSLRARSRSVYLASPYDAPGSRTNGAPATMAQLALSALEFSGFDLTWSAEDWTVAAGMWAHTGTRIEALARLAEAAGGYITPHRTDAALSVLSRYPVAPWAWYDIGTDVDVILPPDVVTDLGFDPVEAPDYNAVYVTGTTQGIVGHITRLGTAGDIVAPLITEALCADINAARARGMPALAAAGISETRNLVLPISPEVPLLELGQLIHYDAASAWRGLVRSVGIAVTIDQRAGLRVRQSVTIERRGSAA